MRLCVPFIALTCALCCPLAVEAAVGASLKRLEASNPAALRLIDDGPGRTLRAFHAGPYPGSPEQAARAFVAEHGGALVAEGTMPELAHERTVSWHGRSMVHLRQLHRGIPVLGAGVMVKLEGDGAAVMATSHLRPGLTTDTEPTLDRQNAQARGLATVPEGELATTPSLFVLDRPSSGRLVYRVPVFASSPPASWMVTLDAHTGEVLDVSDLRLSAEGDVYPGSPATSEVTTVTLTDLAGDETWMNGTYALVRSTVFDGDVSGVEHLAEADADGNFFYEPAPDSASDPFVEVHTYHHVTDVSRWLEDSQGHVFDGPAIVTTNYRGSEGAGYDNAYFTNGPQGEVLLVFGQGFIDFAYDADIVTHEFGHSIIQDRTQMLLDQLVIYDRYGWNMAPGALHEGIADYYAGSRFDDPCMAEYAIDPCMRELDNAHTCPEDLYGEVHYDGLIPGAASWDIHEIVGGEVTDDLVYGALGMIGQTPTFAGYAEAISELAGDLADDGVLTAADVEAIDEALEARGMFRCGRTLTLEPGSPLSFEIRHMLGFESFDPDTCDFIRGLDVQFTAPFQFGVTIPADMTDPVDRVELTVELERLDGEPMGIDDLQYAMYARADDMVTLEFDVLEIAYFGDFAIPHALEYDLAVEDEPTTVVVAADDVALEPGSTVYFSMIHMNCPGVTITVSGTIVPGEPVEEDGCKCTAQGTSGSSTAVGLLLALAAAWISRRGRPDGTARRRAGTRH